MLLSNYWLIYWKIYLFEKTKPVGKANLNCLKLVSGLQLPGYAGSYPQNPSQCPVDPIWILCWYYTYRITWIQVWFGEYRLQFMQVLILFSQLLTSCLHTAFILRNLSCSSPCWCFYLVFRNRFLCQLYILKISSHWPSENYMSRLLRHFRTTSTPLPMQHDLLLYFLPYKLFFFHKFKCFFTYSWCKVSYSLITVTAFPLGQKRAYFLFQLPQYMFRINNFTFIFCYSHTGKEFWNKIQNNLRIWSIYESGFIYVESRFWNEM